MGRRGRQAKKRREDEDGNSESTVSTYIPPSSVLRKLHQQTPPPDPSSPLPPGSKYITRQSLIGLRSRTRNLKEVLSASSHLSPERSLSAEKVAQPTPTAANSPALLLPQTQEASSLQLKFQTRALLAHCGTTRTPLRAAVRNVKSVPSSLSPERNVPAKNLDQPMAEIPDLECPLAPEASSQEVDPMPPHQNTDGHNQNENPSSPTSSFNGTKIAAMLDFTDPLSPLAQEAGSQEVAPTPPHQNMDGQKQNENPPNPASSFNCTEIAAMVANDWNDPDEVASKAYPALVTINGYRVKEEIAPLVRSIISKYGDIGKECIFKSLEVRSSVIEKVCRVYQNLEETESLLVTPVELKSMLDVVEDLESMKMNVKWLHNRLDEIKETVKLAKGYSALKDALATNLTARERKKKELKVMQDELDAMETEGAKITEALVGTRAKIKPFYRRQSLVDGLL